MSAKTPWWYCGKCGFANHPRDARVYHDPDINEKCEQCGSGRELEESLDYRPAGA